METGPTKHVLTLTTQTHVTPMGIPPQRPRFAGAAMPVFPLPDAEDPFDLRVSPDTLDPCG